MNLEELYKYLYWRMDPSDERAIKRFQQIIEVFKKFRDSGLVPTEAKILDICAGTGIAGVAMAKVTKAKTLTLLDARESDLKKSKDWVKIAGLELKPKLVVGDARNVAELVDEHDVAILWGLTMPHFDAFDAVKLFAGVASILSEDGVFLLEESDRVYSIFYRTGYKDILVETKTDTYTLISIHDGYDPIRGVFKRTYYKLPGFEKITEQAHRLWDIASQLSLGSVFFKEYKAITPSEHGVIGVSTVLYFRKPRKKVADEILRR
ncbi:class I SAM-dependent methyltransferase [Pyrococcus horikoshii]|nr:class I SAM-dependent methyltransferase [Pyrococcus horikoshii]HII60307.1 class I SAM-dependent methyltransferase [Pyrococcus horikoshii]